MELRAVCISNGIGVLLMSFLLYVSRTRRQRPSYKNRIFTFVALGVLVACIIEACSFIVDSRIFPGGRFLNYATNACLFTAGLVLPLFVLFYVDLGLYGDPERIPKCYRLHVVLLILMNLVNVINFFVPVSFYVTEENVYHRLPVGYIFYIVIFFYAASGIYVKRRYEKERGAHRFFVIEAFLLPIVLGTLLQIFFYGLSLAWPCCAIGLTFLYMMQQNELAYIDSLVGLFNRQYMDDVLSSWIRKGYAFGGIMIDVDHFKSINDAYGHSEGDHALIRTADILKSVAKDGSLAFRFAGDEFVLLKRTENPQELEELAKKLEETLEETNRAHDVPWHLSLSCGISFFDRKAGNVDSFLKAMDTQLYITKKQHHLLSRNP